MKSISSLLACVFLFYAVSAPITGLAYAQSRTVRVAVLDLKGEGVSASEARTLTDRFRSEMVRTNIFTVLERNQMDAVLEEQGFQQSGCVSDECMVEIGRLIGVQAMAGGSIGKIGQTYTIDIRLIEVETGKILRTVSEDYKGSVDGLLNVLKTAANKLAGQKTASTEVKESSGGGFPWLWVGLGVVAAGAGAAVLLGSSSGGDDGGSQPPANLPDPGGIWPPSSK